MIEPSSSCNVIEARIDWITATNVEPSGGTALLMFAERMQQLEEAKGYQSQPWGAHGYTGRATRHVRAGWSEQGGIVCVSGEMAEGHALDLAELAAHWSRVDLCVTVRQEKPAINPVADYWERWQREYTKASQPRKLRQTRECWGGQTCYIGERSSAYFLRCYDKHAESEGDYPPGCWRWEVELKRHASEGWHARYLVGGLTEALTADFVAAEYRRLRLPVPWVQNTAVKRDPQVKHRADADEKLKWFELGVSGAVQFTRGVKGDPAVIRALGLDRTPRLRREPDKAPEAAPWSWRLDRT